MAGLVIQGRYEVIRRLAIGGMGEIFLARQTGAKGFSRLVILKTLRPELAEEPGALDQFLDEARVAALLNHPNIVAVYEVGVHDGVHFIAMEYIGGVDLSALLRMAHRQSKRIPLRVAAALVKDAATALDFAHHARDENGQPLNVVHRDVSPQNLMIRSDGILKVVDFGVAVSSNQMHETQGDKLKGKIRYMSPEQLLGEDLDGRSDLFSLGIVLWELCAGRALYSGSNPIDVFQKILAGTPTRLAVAAPEAEGALENIVHKMLALKRTDRYARGDDVASALRTWLEDTGAKGAQVSDDVRAVVADVAGAAIADRVKDLSERATSLRSSSGTTSGWGDAVVDPGALSSADTNAATRVSVPPVSGAGVEPPALESGAGDATRVVHARDLPGLDDGDPLGAVDPIEHSDGGALLWAAEHSGALRGDRRFVTVLFGLLPGWGQLAQQIANVPMGAFGVTRVKNLFFRQLATLASEKGGTVVRRGPDAFVVAFGLGEPRAEDATHALACAFATQKLLDDLARDPRQRLVAHMGVAGGLALANVDDGPVQLAGGVADKAERLAALARSLGKGVLVSGQVGELARGDVNLEDAGKQDGDPILHATGLVDRPEASRVKRRKILIADDAEVVRRIEEEILRPFSYAFTHAKNGAEAVRIAVEELPDLVLLDIQMPVMDGMQVLSVLKKTDKTKHIPVVVITTIGRAHDEDLVRRGGADAFLTKPVKPGVLIQTVRNLLKD